MMFSMGFFWGNYHPNVLLDFFSGIPSPVMETKSTPLMVYKIQCGMMFIITPSDA
jgi:hypothetical protein